MLNTVCDINQEIAKLQEQKRLLKAKHHKPARLKTSIVLSSELLDALKERANKDNTSVSKLIEQACFAYISKE